MSEESKIKVWSRFEAEKDGSVIKLRIQDVPSDRKEDVSDFIMTHLLRDEAFHKAAGILKSEEAKIEFQELSKMYYEIQLPHITICCLDVESNVVGEILGMSILILSKNTDKLEDFVKLIQVKTKKIERDGFRIKVTNFDAEIVKICYLDSKSMPIEQFFYAAKVLLEYTGSKNDYGIFYEGRGVIVRPDYRKLGMANEFIRLRKQICIDHDVPMTCAWMTSIGTQKASEKNGWKTFAEISVRELEKKTGLQYDNNVPSFKLMYTIKD